MGTGLGGQGESDGPFWDNYCVAYLPSPEAVTVPFCMRLIENNDGDVAAAASAVASAAVASATASSAAVASAAAASAVVSAAAASAVASAAAARMIQNDEIAAAAIEVYLPWILYFL